MAVAERSGTRCGGHTGTDSEVNGNGRSGSTARVDDPSGVPPFGVSGPHIKYTDTNENENIS